MADASIVLSTIIPLLGPAVVFAGWLVAQRDDRRGRGYFLKLWLGALAALVALGVLVGALDADNTRRGLAILYSSPSWLMGPLLLPLLGRPHELTAIGVSVLAVPAGGVLGLIAAVSCGAINPCG